MRLVYISDLHTDLSDRNLSLLDALVRQATALRPDVFVVAGDLAETLRDVDTSLQRLAAIPALRLYLAGNHDLFVEGDPRSAPDSREKFERLLPAVASAAGFTYLGLDPVVWQEIAFVGVPGWYDFTLRDPCLDGVADSRTYARGSWRGHRAYDRGHVFWPQSAASPDPGAHPSHLGGDWAGDEDIADCMLQRLETQLQAVRDAATIVGIIHVLPFPALVQRGVFGDSPFFDAYLGSARLGSCLEQFSAVRAVVSGHLHRRARITHNGIQLVASPVGDARKSSLDLADLARERLGLLEL